MSPEIATMLGVGVAIVAFLRCAMTDMEQRLGKRIDRLESKVDGLARDHGSLAGEMAGIRERMTRLEGLFEGFVRGEPPAEAPAAE